MKDTVVGRMSLTKWILLFIFGIIFFAGLGYVCSWVSGLYAEDKLKFSLICAGLGIAVLFLYLVLSSLLEGRQVDELHPGGIFPGILKGWFIALLFFGIITGLLAAFGFYRIESVDVQWEYILGSLAGTFMFAIGEEVLFRGIIFRLLDQRWNTVIALLVPAILNGVLVYYLRPNADIWATIASAIEGGLLFGIIFKSSGNLWVPIGLNWMWTYLSGSILGFPFAGVEVPGALFVPQISGPKILTGGEFGPEASIFAVAISIGLMLYFLTRMKVRRDREDKRIIKPMLENNPW